MSASSFTTVTLQIGDLHLRLLEAGQPGNPVVLLIQGGLGDAELHWHRTLAELGVSFHVFAPDLPGFHAGSDVLKQPSLPHIMEWINNLLDELHEEKVLLIGTSVGGLIARFYAAQYPALVERLILVDGGQIANIPGMMRTLINMPGIAQAFYSAMYRQTYSRHALQRNIYQQNLLTEDFFRITNQASKGYMLLIRAFLAEPWPAKRTPTCPTLIIWGQEDHLASPSEGRKMLTEIPHAELSLIEKSGHMPMIEQPELFSAAVMKFIRG